MIKMTRVLLPMICLLPLVSFAADAEPSVEENVQLMDTDHDGMVSVSEIKAYLQEKFGSHYQESLLNKMEVAAKAQSCDSSFTRPFRQ